MTDHPRIQQTQPNVTEAGRTEPASNKSGSAKPGEGRGRRFVGGLRSRFWLALKEPAGLLFGHEKRHQRLHGRLIGLVTASLLLDFLIAGLLYRFDSFSDKPHQNFGKAIAWTTSQMLVGGSSYAPPAHAGHILEVVLQVYAIIVIAAIAGSFASFFISSDS
jgi:hypothetical protein